MWDSTLYMDIIKGLGTAADVLRKADKIPEYQQILDAMRRLSEQETEISDLKRENRQLKEDLEIKKKLVHIAEVYYFEEDNHREKPFCAKCYDVEIKLVHMTEWRDGKKRCPNCQNTYKYI